MIKKIPEKKDYLALTTLLACLVAIAHLRTVPATITSPLPDTYRHTISVAKETIAPRKSTKSKPPQWQTAAYAIIEAFAPEGKEATEWALRCFYSESKWDAKAKNVYNADGSIDVGIAQINSVHAFTGDLENVEYNLEKALEIYQIQGKKAWYGKKCND